MDAEHVWQEDISTTAALIVEDDWADVTAVVQTDLNVLMTMHGRTRAKLIERRRRYCGCCVGRRAKRRRDSAAGLQEIVRDYIGVGREPPNHEERVIETRFGVPRTAFRRFCMEVKEEPFFKQRINATGNLKAHPP